MYLEKTNRIFMKIISYMYLWTHRRRSDWNSGGRMAGITIKVLL